MNNESSNVEISVSELKLLVNTLSKSVALSLKRRFAWLWLIAGLVIGVSLTLLIINLTWQKTEKKSVTTETLLKKTDVVMSDLKKINSDITKLTQTVTALNESTKTDKVPQPSFQAKPIELIKPEQSQSAKTYSVYLHYSDIKNKTLIENFSAFLKENGFNVSGIQKVNYKGRDIRFFHDQDQKGAFLLKKHLIDFIQSVKNVNGERIRVIDLSRKYPEAEKGLLEVWVDF